MYVQKQTIYEGPKLEFFQPRTFFAYLKDLEGSLPPLHPMFGGISLNKKLSLDTEDIHNHSNFTMPFLGKAFVTDKPISYATSGGVDSGVGFAGYVVRYTQDRQKGTVLVEVLAEDANELEQIPEKLDALNQGLRKIVRQITTAAEGSNKDKKVESFLINLFGPETNIQRIKDYFEQRGIVTNLKKLLGGFSSQAVVSLGSLVTKLDISLLTAKMQRDFHSRDFGELNHYIPNCLSDKITIIDNLALWDMSNISKKYQEENLFDRSRENRSRLDNDSFKVIQTLNTQDYILQNFFAKKQGARDLYDLIDHYMYVAGLLHSNSKPLDFNGLSIGSSNKIVAGNKVLDDITKELREKADSVIHGDFWFGNTVSGALIDPKLRKGNAVEDITRFLTDPQLNLDQKTITHFIHRYVQHRFIHDEKFREDRQKQKSLFINFNLSQYEDVHRRITAMQKFNLKNPLNIAQLTTYIIQAKKLKINS